MQIGARIKQLRETRKMTLTELSEKSGVQIATLSRMENLKMTGTLESHMAVARALGVDITHLYKDIDKEEKKSKLLAEPKHSETFAYNDRASYEILTSKVLEKKMMPVVLRIESGGQTNPEQNPPGSEKFLFILDGAIEAHVGDNSYPLSKNHTLYFDSSVKHYFTNQGKTTAKVICVTTPVAL